MKKIILISLLTAALVFIPGCGQDNPDEEKSSLPESSINSFTLESTEPSEVSQAVYFPPSDAIYMFNGDTVGPLYSVCSMIKQFETFYYPDISTR